MNTRAARVAALALVALAFALIPGCAGIDSEDPDSDPNDDYGIDGPLEPEGPLGKADSVHVVGPSVSTWTGDTQVWKAKNAWEDVDTIAARKAGIAWPAESGLDWDEKFARWIESMPRRASESYFETFTLTTPWGKTLPAPKLECAELAMFLRVTFAAWYELPFFMTALDQHGTRVYFGHFGARTKTSRYKETPQYAYWYKDYSNWSAEQIAAGWPQDQKLRERGLYGGDDQMDFVFPGAHAGAYFDEIHLNKRAGHFLRLLLGFFGSVHLADARNAYNLKPSAIRAGDVLVERWQRHGIGHALVLKDVRGIPGGLYEAELASGSMPRRQPKWENAVASKSYFTSELTGGDGVNDQGDEYVALGGGIKRFRVTKNIGGNWTNTWMAADEASWINDTDHAALRARPAAFQQLLGQVSPQALRDALLGIIDDSRHHLRSYPASCAARARREDAFEELYEVMGESFGRTRAQVDTDYRVLEDYVFAELEYATSKTCCWNKSTSAMYQIVMDYNRSLLESSCQEPVVFKCQGGGYQLFANYAAQTGRAHLWKPWSEDESCPQRNVSNDTEADSQALAWCSVVSNGGGGESGCADDAFEDNDTSGTAKAIAIGAHDGLAVCCGDDDYYRVTVSSGVAVSISFDHDAGDLDLEIYAGSTRIDVSDSVSNGESVSAAASGTYVVRVLGYNGAAGTYSLSVTPQ